MIVQCGNFVIACVCVCVPPEKLIRSGLTDKFLIGEAINFLHIGIDFFAQRDRVAVSNQTVLRRLGCALLFRWFSGRVLTHLCIVSISLRRVA